VCSVNYILDRISGQTNNRSASSGPDPGMHTIEQDEQLRTIKLKLSPVREVENILSKGLSADRTIVRRSSAMPLDIEEQITDVFVRSGSRWKSLLGIHTRSAGPDQLDKAYRIIEACKETIISMWNHPTVQSAVQQKIISLPEQAALCVPLFALVGKHTHNSTRVKFSIGCTTCFVGRL
jgi:hypothetical protein